MAGNTVSGVTSMRTPVVFIGLSVLARDVGLRDDACPFLRTLHHLGIPAIIISDDQSAGGVIEGLVRGCAPDALFCGYLAAPISGKDTDRFTALARKVACTFPGVDAKQSVVLVTPKELPFAREIENPNIMLRRENCSQALLELVPVIEMGLQRQPSSV